MKTDDVPVLVANRIRTQVELAKLVGVTRAAISQWETRTPKLRREHILALAEHLNRPPRYFSPIGGDDGQLSPTQRIEQLKALLKEADEMREALAELCVEFREAVDKLLLAIPEKDRRP